MCRDRSPMSDIATNEAKDLVDNRKELLVID